jgi:hypothetical protein
MSLNRGTVNALGLLGFRKLNFIPDHFAKISIEHRYSVKDIEHWIEYNLNGRYAIQDSHGLDQNRKLITITEIGIEDPKELTMLAVGCTHLHKKKEI